MSELRASALHAVCFDLGNTLIAFGPAQLEGLGLSPAACVHVGDNWLADIQGAKGAGLQAVHTTEHVSYQDFEPQPGDLEPDARIGALAELEALL